MQTMLPLANNGTKQQLSERSEIRLHVDIVIGGSGVCEWICLFIDVCVCLTAVVMFRMLANMFVHEWQQVCKNARVTEMQREM